jgi:hypothetical protein
MTRRTDILFAGAVALLISLLVTLGRDLAFGDEVGIHVSELEFIIDPVEGAAIRQVRNVEGRRPVAAIWTASVTRQDNDEVICKGSGHFRYPVGARSPVLPLDQWVGDQGCWARLPEGVPLQACAEYEVGDQMPDTACSTIFAKRTGFLAPDPAP